MKNPRWAGVLLLVGALLGVEAGPAQESWRLPGLDGGALTSADVAEGNTVVVVWAGWSPRCRDIARQVAELRSQIGSKARLVTVNFQEKDEEIRQFLREQPIGSPVYLDRDGAFSRQHRVTTLPGWVIYRAGEVVHQGKLPSDPGPTLERSFGSR